MSAWEWWALTCQTSQHTLFGPIGGPVASGRCAQLFFLTGLMCLQWVILEDVLIVGVGLRAGVSAAIGIRAPECAAVLGFPDPERDGLLHLLMSSATTR